MKKLIKRIGGKILSILYRPIINLLKEQNNTLLHLKVQNVRNNNDIYIYTEV